MFSFILKVKIGLALLVSITSCALQSDFPVSDYQNQLSYPEQTEELFFLEQNDSENPLFGTQLTYQSKFYELDLFTVFIYPVRHLDWQDPLPVLMDEASMAFQSLDEYIQENNYQSRSLEDIEQLNWQLSGKPVQGVRGVSRVHLHDELYMHNYSYFFIEQDKVIRISANMKFAEQLPPPDEFVQGLLIKLNVPQESPYMAQLRASLKTQN
mgnify:CR=1 FL=1